ncbi:MAG: adenylate/guanylate cyclase domain-containing protein, partial [Spirochaetales bacterium]|nr:adenylate/guanylate cyclase domain-containing protein [Spirochaetales bacterium]
CLLSVILFAVRRLIRQIGGILLPMGAAVAIFLLFTGESLWIYFAPVFVSTIAAAISHWYLSRRRLSAGLRKAIGFDPELISAFRRKAQDGNVLTDVAILCTDIRSYTNFVADTEPGVVSSVMSEYLHVMERAISSHGGYVNKYVGDEIIGIFGFPLSDEAAAARSVECGIAMFDVLGDLISAWEQKGIRHFDHIGMGIDFGTVTFTEVGGRSRTQFDIIGNAINGAARFQSLTKDVGCPLVISNEVVRELLNDDRGSAVRGRFNPIGSYPIRGQGERLVYAFADKV